MGERLGTTDGKSVGAREGMKVEENTGAADGVKLGFAESPNLVGLPVKGEREGLLVGERVSPTAVGEEVTGIAVGSRRQKQSPEQ